MKLHIAGLTLLSAGALASITSAAAEHGHEIVTAAETGLAQAVAVAAQAGNPIGSAALAAATAAEATGKTGAAKKADVVAAIVPLIVSEAAKGSVTAVVADAEHFAGLVVEAVVAAMKTTPIGQIATALLHAFGVA